MLILNNLLEKKMNSEDEATNNEGETERAGRADENNEQMRRWREIYGDMVPESIVDTKVGEVRHEY